ncbi:MAG TPA: hypothetical protein VFS10_14905 [Pyrinomonadaceae bacterium]|nr:hypothetical protein [Pyrinomonadaceae bacterium]
MKSGKPFFKNEARWNLSIHYGVFLLGLPALLFALLVGWPKS